MGREKTMNMVQKVTTSTMDTIMVSLKRAGMYTGTAILTGTPTNHMITMTSTIMDMTATKAIATEACTTVCGT
jgi:hypothetical protein